MYFYRFHPGHSLHNTFPRTDNWAIIKNRLKRTLFPCTWAVKKILQLYTIDFMKCNEAGYLISERKNKK